MQPGSFRNSDWSQTFQHLILHSIFQGLKDLMTFRMKMLIMLYKPTVFITCYIPVKKEDKLFIMLILLYLHNN